MNIPPLLRLAYWFDLNPAPFMPWVERFLPIAFILLLFVGILLRMVAWRRDFEKLTRRALRKAASMLMVLGVVGLLLFVFAYERVYVLSMRFGYLIWFGLLAWYVWRLMKYVRVEIPAIERRQAEREKLNKWLPKASK